MTKTSKNAASQAEQETLVFGKQYSHFKIIYFVKCFRSLVIISSVLTWQHKMQDVMQG